MDNDLSLLQDFVILSNGYSAQREKTRYLEVDPMAHYPEEAFKRRYRMSKKSHVHPPGNCEVCSSLFTNVSWI